MAEPEWVELGALLPLHSKSIAAHGGVEDLRDQGLLESALQRPINRYHYEGVEDLSALAATYGVAVAGNHPFLDGNKRAAFLCLALFLRLNGRRLTAGQVDATRTMYAVAAGELKLEQLETWVRSNSEPA
ncbi:MAG TPA: type II toxin-antitoxin system death-on-curing family toxin [Caulobacteraceae bacterium]|jgi:death-on-curing protein